MRAGRGGMGGEGKGRFVEGDGVLRCGGEFDIRGGSGNPHAAITLFLPSASL